MVRFQNGLQIRNPHLKMGRSTCKMGFPVLELELELELCSFQMIPKNPMVNFPCSLSRDPWHYLRCRLGTEVSWRVGPGQRLQNVMTRFGPWGCRW